MFNLLKENGKIEIKLEKLKDSEDYSWITVPIKKEFKKKNISECEIDYSYEWQKDHLNKIKNVYSKTLYFNEIYETILNKIHLKYNSLSELNISLIKLVMSYLEIDTKLIMSSTIKVDGQERR
ncbi:WbqC family protein [Candidatus Pelagibacter sp. Uisw_114]